MKRITPRTCLWPLTGALCAGFALSIGLTYRSNHHCFAGTCGEWLFPLQARLHVIVWYMWLSLSISLLAFRAFQPSLRAVVSRSCGWYVPLLDKQLRVSGLLLVFWISALYGIAIGIWWKRLDTYFQERGAGLSGNNLLATVALTGHLADITTGMVLLPVSRHSALASFFKLSPSTIYSFHMTMAYVLFGLITIHASLYAGWVAIFNRNVPSFQGIFPVLNPTYLFNEVWPGDTSALGIWRASLIFSGSTSSLIMLAMFLTSFPIIRRKHFNLFYFTHVLGIVAVVVICLHASTMFYCTLPGLSMWLLDWGMRVYELRQKLNSRLKKLGNGWYSVELPMAASRLSGCACHSPLAHFYIHHSGSSIREIHPFTTITHLATSKLMLKENEDTINVQFLFRRRDISSQESIRSISSIRKKQEWTQRLGSLVDEEMTSIALADGSVKDQQQSGTTGEANKPSTEVQLRLEGPYFTPANPELYKTVVCLVAGTGLSGAIAIAEAFRARKRTMQSCRAPLNGESATACVKCSSTAGKADVHWKRCVVIWSVRETEYVDMTHFQALKSSEDLEFRVHKTGGNRPRLDVPAVLSEICGKHGNDSWCYISGPDGYISAVEQACLTFPNLKWFAARWT